MALLIGFAVAVVALGGLGVPTLSEVYYVSNDGSDENDGRSEATALRTVAQAASRVGPGGSILLRRGDVFRESVQIEPPDVHIDAYGPAEAEPPVISGSVPITGWRRHDGDVWVAETDAQIGYLYVDGRLMTIARYPNDGWLRTRQWREEELPRQPGQGRRRPRGPRKTYVTCPELANHPRNADGYWVGANIRWRHHSWWYETRKVIGYDASGILTLGDRSFSATGPHGYDARGWGFYLDGKLEELDAPGEWYFDAETGKVYLYPPDGKDPNSLLVEGTACSVGLSVRDSTVRNVCFRHQKDIGLRIDGRCVVEHCTFEGIGRDATVSEHGAGGGALRAERGVRETCLRHNVFRNNLNNSIEWWQDPHATGSSFIEHNTVVNSGTVRGYGGSGSWHAVGVLIGRGAHVLVRYNRIDGTGYAGILFGSDGNTAEFNVVRNAMATLNDGAGIYTNCSRSTIRHNIILDVKGGMESSGTWPNISHGIWLEFLGNYRDSIVEGNTCARCGGDGIFLTNNYECVVRDNVLYGNERFQLLLSGRGESESEDPNQKHLIENNVLYACRPGQKLLYFDPRFNYGTLRGNYYCSPHADRPIVAGIGWPGTSGATALTLAAWRRDYPWADAEPKVPALAAGEVDSSELFVNDSDRPETIALDGPYRDLDGNAVEGSIRLEPFSSLVLLHGNSR